jgi:hypothetical protein
MCATYVGPLLIYNRDKLRNHKLNKSSVFSQYTRTHGMEVAYTMILCLFF